MLTLSPNLVTAASAADSRSPIRFGTRTADVPHPATPTVMPTVAQIATINRVSSLTNQHPELSTGEPAFQFWEKDPSVLLTPPGDESGIPVDWQLLVINQMSLFVVS